MTVHVHDIDVFLSNDRVRMEPLRGALTWDRLKSIVNRYADQEERDKWGISEEWDPETIIHLLENPYNGCATVIFEPPIEV